MTPNPRTEPGDRLACGESADELIAQVADGNPTPRGDHQSECPHCRAALAEYDRLWSPVQAFAATPVRTPQRLLDTALGRLRAATANPTYAVLTDDQGQTRIAARVVVVTARDVAQHVDGVRVALSKVAPDLSQEPEAAHPDGRTLSVGEEDGGSPRARVGVAGRSAAITLTVAANYGEDLADLGARIRVVVIDRVRADTGLDPVDVSVVIDDVLPVRPADSSRLAG